MVCYAPQPKVYERQQCRYSTSSREWGAQKKANGRGNKRLIRLLSTTRKHVAGSVFFFIWTLWSQATYTCLNSACSLLESRSEEERLQDIIKVCVGCERIRFVVSRGSRIGQYQIQRQWPPDVINGTTTCLRTAETVHHLCVHRKKLRNQQRLWDF